MKIDYKSQEEVEKERALIEKREKVRGLVKNTFGHSVVVTSSGNNIFLSSLFGFPFLYGNIAVIDVSRNRMDLALPGYERRAGQFGCMYDAVIGNNNELHIQANYPRTDKS